MTHPYRWIMLVAGLSLAATGPVVAQEASAQPLTDDARPLQSGTSLTVIDPAETIPSINIRAEVAKTLAAEQRYFSAVAELFRAAGPNAPSRMSEDFQWQLADSLLAFSVRDAQSLYRTASVLSDDTDRYVASQMALADHDYRHGRLDSAMQVLKAVEDRVPEAERDEWQKQVARVLLAQGRFADAIEILKVLDEGLAGRNVDRVVRFNLGLAQLNDGRELEGRDTLDKVGRAVAYTEEDHAIRDRANLILGWHFLRNEQGGTAKAVFQRIRMNGPSSNRALLGLGWAELLPRGERQARVSRLEEEEDPFAGLSTLGGLLRPGYMEGDVYRRAGFNNFSRASMADDEEEALQRALGVWVELIGRDPLDPAVQEAWLAIPYALDRIGAYRQAIDYYERAIEVLETNVERQKQAQISIRGGVMLNTLVRRDPDSEAGRDWELLDLPDTPETYYLQEMLAGHRFQESLKQYRDLSLMARNLEGWEERLLAVRENHRRDVREPADPAEVIEVARYGSAPPTPPAGSSLTLQGATSLAAPGRYQRPHAVPNLPGVRLPMTATPPAERFNGVYERANSLRREASDLRMNVEQARDRQAALLTEMASEALAEQQLTIDKFLVEARFALARLYDRELDPPTAESDDENGAP